ncbi:energy-coupling factor transporter transmembrane protein EcfT [Methanolapillus ohkumae]|uniref:Energy-coupling factor transporter transmembrane protein EcfT n=1 Tax=Methanolapillus ohkumae TaxID=3028298 RepID=A0AA96ZW95_9EURY|nr:Energy-coupling factor transporter transmembrane protein EcfT [Methanosarcinaceae archaeon Am2]
MVYKKFLTYESGKSLFHKLDPRTKIIALMVISLIIFSQRFFSGLIFISILLLICVFVSRVPFRKLILSVKPMFFFIFLVFLLHFLFTSDPFAFHPFYDIRPAELMASGHNIYVNPDMPLTVSVVAAPVVTFRFLSPSFYSFFTGLGVALKFLLLILFAALMTATTKESDIIQGIDKLVRPLLPKKTGLTSHDLAVMIFLSIRFIPLLITTGEQITTSASSRGFEIKKHPVRYIRILSAGLVSSIIRFSDDVSFAMENRGYTGTRRTYMNELKMKPKDAVFLTIFAVICFLFFAFAILFFIYSAGYM